MPTSGHRLREPVSQGRSLVLTQPTLPQISSSVRAPAGGQVLQSADTFELLRSVRNICLRNGDPRDLHEPGQVRPGFQQRRGDEIRPFKPCDRRTQHEREKNGERDRHEDGLPSTGRPRRAHSRRTPPTAAMFSTSHPKARPIRGPSRENTGRKVPLRQNAWRLNRSSRAAACLNPPSPRDDAGGKTSRNRAQRTPRFRLKPCVCRTIRRRRAAALRGR
jgi:hypothetical protein